MTSQALVFYSLGLFFYSMNQTLTPLFYANKDTSTPVKIAGTMVLINICLNFILMQFMAHRGLALSTSITSMLNFIVLIRLIKKQLPSVKFARIIPHALKTVGICGVLYLIAFMGKSLYPASGRIQLIGRDAAIMAICLTVFYLLGLLVRLEYLSDVGSRLWQRFHRN